MSTVPESISQEKLIMIWFNKLTPEEKELNKGFVRKLRAWRGRRINLTIR